MWESDGDLLRLRLGTGLSCPSTASGSDSTRAEGSSAAPQSRQHQPEQQRRRRQQQQQQQQEKITIFYNGRICVCDVTEIQARTIINMAKREMDSRRTNMSVSPFQSPPPSPHDDSMPQLLNPGLSMKRSLQRFLQKRKTRIDATAPYEHRHTLLL